jgi:hypothetical protein
MAREDSGIESNRQWVYDLGMNTTAKQIDETLRTLAERDATFEEDRKTAEPWRDVKAELLRNLKHPAPK